MKTHFMFDDFFSRKSNRLWDNVEKSSGDLGPQMTSQYGAYMLRAGLASLSARMRIHTQTSI